MGEDKRKYIRHPSDVPIVYALNSQAPGRHKEPLRNISLGGLCFQTISKLEPGQSLEIEIDLVRPPFRATAQVVWCRPNEAAYDVGVQFLEENASLRSRLVEQICHIEQYKRDVLTTEGRMLSGEEAAIEWIEKYAPAFPRP